MKDLDWSNIIPMTVSALAACVSVYYSMELKSFQKKLLENKFELEQLNVLIEKLKIANAVRMYPFDCDDESFTSGLDLNDVPAKIGKLIQNKIIAEEIVKSEWDLPIENLEHKIELLCKIREKLI